MPKRASKKETQKSFTTHALANVFDLGQVARTRQRGRGEVAYPRQRWSRACPHYGLPVNRSPPPRPRTTPVFPFHMRTVVRQENFLTFINVDGMARGLSKNHIPRMALAACAGSHG